MLLKILNKRNKPLDNATLFKISHFLAKTVDNHNGNHFDNLQYQHDIEECPICLKSMENEAITPGEGHPIQAVGRMEKEIYDLIDWNGFLRKLFDFLGILNHFRVESAIDLKKNLTFFDLEKDISNSEKIYYKPDGKPFGLDELQVINQFIKEELQIAPSAIETVMVRSFIIGNIIEKLQREKEIKVMKLQLSSLPQTLKEAIKKYNLTPRQLNSIQFSILRTGEHITKIGETARQTVIKNVIQAQMESKSPGALALDLFHEVTDTDKNLNRDWRRVALYETNSSVSNGYISLCTPGEVLIGRSQPNACDFCLKNINGKEFIVREDPPPDYSQLDPGSRKYKEIAKIWDEEIWLGKNNVGRSLSKRQKLASGEYRNREHHELWTVTIPAHPHCRCGYYKKILA